MTKLGQIVTETWGSQVRKHNWSGRMIAQHSVHVPPVCFRTIRRVRLEHLLGVCCAICRVPRSRHLRQIADLDGKRCNSAAKRSCHAPAPPRPASATLPPEATSPEPAPSSLGSTAGATAAGALRCVHSRGLLYALRRVLGNRPTITATGRRSDVSPQGPRWTGDRNATALRPIGRCRVVRGIQMSSCVLAFSKGPFEHPNSVSARRPRFTWTLSPPTYHVDCLFEGLDRPLPRDTQASRALAL